MIGKKLWPILLALELAACGGAPVSAPLSDQAQGIRQPESELREVVHGDTLYSIAWESGRDFRELATWNNIPAPYTIYPGQKLRMYPPDGAVAEDAPAPSGNGAVYVVQRGDTLYRIARRSNASVRELAAWNGLRSPYLLYPGQRLRLTAPDTARGAPTPSTKREPATARSRTPGTSARRGDPAPAARLGTWSWPAQGALLERYQPNGASKGIDIAGKKGQPVHAAADGQVVYQGSGLRGYGQLIIVKHNADFLSAYAHCDRIYVKEGDVVKRGQKIADIGSSGTDRSKLHFEIRYRGKPVDPLEHLPKK